MRKEEEGLPGECFTILLLSPPLATPHCSHPTADMSEMNQHLEKEERRRGGGEGSKEPVALTKEELPVGPIISDSDWIEPEDKRRRSARKRKSVVYK